VCCTPAGVPAPGAVPAVDSSFHWCFSLMPPVSHAYRQKSMPGFTELTSGKVRMRPGLSPGRLVAGGVPGRPDDQGRAPARYRIPLPAGPPRSTSTRCHRPGAATHQPTPPPRHRQTSPDVPRRPLPGHLRQATPASRAAPATMATHQAQALPTHTTKHASTQPSNQARKHTTNQATKNPGGSGRG